MVLVAATMMTPRSLRSYQATIKRRSRLAASLLVVGCVLGLPSMQPAADIEDASRDNAHDHSAPYQGQSNREICAGDFPYRKMPCHNQALRSKPAHTSYIRSARRRRSDVRVENKRDTGGAVSRSDIAANSPAKAVPAYSKALAEGGVLPG